MKISVISRWYNEEFLAPLFLGHYAYADEIFIMLDKTTTDKSEEIIQRYPNTRIEYFDHGGVINDGLMAEMMSDLCTSLKSDWVIYVDADEFAFPIGMEDPRMVLSQADGNLIETWFRWVYRHISEKDLDLTLPAIWQRRHGGNYTLFGMNDKFMKPCIIKPETLICWMPGTHGYRPNPVIKVSSTKFDGVHWQMADVENAVKRMIEGRERRLSAENIRHGWGVRHLTEAKIRTECEAHLNDPRLF